MAAIGQQQQSSSSAARAGRAVDVLLAGAVALAVPLVALGLLSLPQLGVAGAVVLVAVLAVAGAVLVVWRRRGWVRWRPVLAGAVAGGVVSLGALAWFAVSFSRSMGAMG